MPLRAGVPYFPGNPMPTALALRLGAGLWLSLVAGPLAAQVRLAPRHAMLPLDDDPTESMAVADFDGDGHPDVLWGNGLTQNRLHLNDGWGGFTDASGNLPVDADPTCALVAADFDGDGDSDLFLGNGFGGAANRLYENEGGVFTDVTAGRLPVDADGTEDAQAADVDGDGHWDLVLGNDGEGVGQQNRLYLGDGAGAFTDATAAGFPLDADPTEGLAVGDLDGDGHTDAIFVNDGAANRLYLGDGAGVFVDASFLLPPTPVLDSEAVALGDLNLDGCLDVVIGNSGPGERQNRLYLADGLGGFLDGTAGLPMDDDDTEGLALGDVNGDGFVDLLCVNFFAEDRLYLGDGSGTLVDAPGSLPPLVPASTKARLEDLDGDGDLDALVGHFLLENRLWLNDGLGGYHLPRSHLPAGFRSAVDVLAFDAEGDGDADLYLADDGLADLLLLNDGSGQLTPFPEGLPAFVVATSCLAAADLDGDGDTDLYLGTPLEDVVLLHTADARFEGALVDPAPVATVAVALADLNSDGHADALGARPSGAFLKLNDGDAVFSEAIGLPPLAGDVHDLVLGDVNADGDLDALFAHGPPGGAPNTLWVGDGAGGFADASGGLGPDADESRALALSDVDHDGHPDLVVGNGLTAGAPNRLYLGTGAATFDPGPALPSPTDATADVVLADFDLDGHLDLAWANDGGPDRLATGDGAGAFTLDAAALSDLSDLAFRTTALAAVDLDGEGDLDLALGTDLGQSRILVNLTRQCSWQTEPRQAKGLTFLLDGPPNQLWVLASSLPAPPPGLPLDPFGTLYLDPSTLAVYASGLLDPTGHAPFVLPIPDNPAVVGLTLPWQAVVGNDPRLTNLEHTSFSDL